MAKNDNIFAMAEKMLNEKAETIKSNQVNYQEILSKTNADIQRLQTESDRAYMLGNIQLGDELTKEKNILKERFAAISHINEGEIKRKSAEENKDVSREFYYLVMKSLKDSDAENLKEVKKHLDIIFDISKVGVDNKTKAFNLLNSWIERVCPFGYGETIVFDTDLAELNRKITSPGVENRIIKNDNKIIML